QSKRLAVGLGLEKSDDRQLGDIVFQMPHHVFESRVWHFHVGEIERQLRRAQLALLQSERVRVIAEQRAQGQSLRSIFHGPPRFPASSAVASRPKIDRLGRADSIVYTIIVEMTRR